MNAAESIHVLWKKMVKPEVMDLPHWYSPGLISNGSLEPSCRFRGAKMCLFESPRSRIPNI